MRVWPELLLVGAFALLRFGELVPASPTVFPDTYDYRAQAKLGLLDPSFWGQARAWGFPLLLAVVPDPLGHPYRVVYVQWLVSLAAWTFLAVVVRVLCRRLWVARTSMGLVLLFAASPTVAMWDADLLSESLALSFMALYLGVVLLFVERATIGLAVAVGAVAVCFAAVRDSNAYL